MKLVWRKGGCSPLWPTYSSASVRVVGWWVHPSLKNHFLRLGTTQYPDAKKKWSFVFPFLCYTMLFYVERIGKCITSQVDF